MGGLFSVSAQPIPINTFLDKTTICPFQDKQHVHDKPPDLNIRMVKHVQDQSMIVVDNAQTRIVYRLPNDCDLISSIVCEIPGDKGVISSKIDAVNRTTNQTTLLYSVDNQANNPYFMIGFEKEPIPVCCINDVDLLLTVIVSPDVRWDKKHLTMNLLFIDPIIKASLVRQPIILPRHDIIICDGVPFRNYREYINRTTTPNVIWFLIQSILNNEN